MTKIIRPLVLTVFILFCLAVDLRQQSLAQTPRPEPTPNDTLISPEVQSDRRVAFRLNAPKASEVILRGDWMETPEPIRLTRDDKGVWAAVVGPLAPDFYSYTLIVDGVRTLDPKNALINKASTAWTACSFCPARRPRSRTTRWYRTARYERSGIVADCGFRNEGP